MDHIKRKNKTKIYRCSVLRCKMNSSAEDIIFHRLPKIDKMRNKWIQKCNLTIKNVNNTFVCSRHFKNEDYLPGKHVCFMKKLQSSIMSIDNSLTIFLA